MCRRQLPAQRTRASRARLHVTHVIRDHATGQVVSADGELDRLSYLGPSEFVADKLAAAVETEAEHCLRALEEQARKRLHGGWMWASDREQGAGVLGIDACDHTVVLTDGLRSN